MNALSSASLLLLLLSLTAATLTSAFSLVTSSSSHGRKSTTPTALSATPSSSSSSSSSRRQVIGGFLSGGLAAAVATATTPGAANAASTEVDYSKVQDLLNGASEFGGQQVYRADPGARPTWLTEPTAEFREDEARASDFKRAQIQAKRTFLAALDRLDTDPDDASKLVADLDTMTDLVHTGRGLPLGITKDELVKRVRRRKGRRPKYWPTTVEIAYQDLVAEIQYQQSPNKEKDEENPL